MGRPRSDLVPRGQRHRLRQPEPTDQDEGEHRWAKILKPKQLLLEALTVVRPDAVVDQLAQDALATPRALGSFLDVGTALDIPTNVCRDDLLAGLLAELHAWVWKDRQSRGFNEDWNPAVICPGTKGHTH